jgi:hypothetical protein
MCRKTFPNRNLLFKAIYIDEYKYEGLSVNGRLTKVAKGKLFLHICPPYDFNNSLILPDIIIYSFGKVFVE